MFCQLNTEEQSQIVITSPKKSKNRKNKKRRATKRNLRKDSNLLKNMSAWVENFATAATWQLKHQIAFWKARAAALEYENRVLHDVIRRNHFDASANDRYMNTGSEHCNEDDFDDRNENLAAHDDHEHENGDYDNLLPSDELVDFLADNMVYKEEARKERERLRAKQERELVVERPETFEERVERVKGLYGDKWQRVAALEMKLAVQFLDDHDENKPTYWPIIPLNY